MNPGKVRGGRRRRPLRRRLDRPRPPARRCPRSTPTGPSRDMIGAVVGLLTLLCALVSGLLIWTAYGVYAGQNAAIQNLGIAAPGPRSRARRLRTRGEPRSRGVAGALWAKPSIRCGARKKATANFAANNFAAGAPGPCAIQRRPWLTSNPRRTSRGRRSPRRGRPSKRSPRRACRWPSRFPLPFPIRFC